MVLNVTYPNLEWQRFAQDLLDALQGGCHGDRSGQDGLDGGRHCL